jgi:hypothetical protein
MQSHSGPFRSAHSNPEAKEVPRTHVWMEKEGSDEEEELLSYEKGSFGSYADDERDLLEGASDEEDESPNQLKTGDTFFLPKGLINLTERMLKKNASPFGLNFSPYLTSPQNRKKNQPNPISPPSTSQSLFSVTFERWNHFGSPPANGTSPSVSSQNFSNQFQTPSSSLPNLMTSNPISAPVERNLNEGEYSGNYRRGGQAPPTTSIKRGYQREKGVNEFNNSRYPSNFGNQTSLNGNPGIVPVGVKGVSYQYPTPRVNPNQDSRILEPTEYHSSGEFYEHSYHGSSCFPSGSHFTRPKSHTIPGEFTLPPRKFPLPRPREMKKARWQVKPKPTSSTSGSEQQAENSSNISISDEQNLKKGEDSGSHMAANEVDSDEKAVTFEETSKLEESNPEMKEYFFKDTEEKESEVNLKSESSGASADQMTPITFENHKALRKKFPQFTRSSTRSPVSFEKSKPKTNSQRSFFEVEEPVPSDPELELIPPSTNSASKSMRKLTQSSLGDSSNNSPQESLNASEETKTKSRKNKKSKLKGSPKPLSQNVNVPDSVNTEEDAPVGLETPKDGNSGNVLKEEVKDFGTTPTPTPTPRLDQEDPDNSPSREFVRMAVFSLILLSVVLNFHPLYLIYLLFFTTVHFMITRNANPSSLFWLLILIGYVLFVKNFQNSSLPQLLI